MGESRYCTRHWRDNAVESISVRELFCLEVIDVLRNLLHSGVPLHQLYGATEQTINNTSQVDTLKKETNMMQ